MHEAKITRYKKARLSKIALTCRILAHEQDHGFGVEIWIVELRADEVVEVVGFLERQQLGLVDLFEALANCGEELRLVLFSPLENSGHCPAVSFPIVKKIAKKSRKCHIRIFI